MSAAYPLSAEDVLEFLTQKDRTRTPSDPPLSAYILGAGFYFDEPPTSDRFRSWMFAGRLYGFHEPLWLQCDLLCLLMLKSPGPLKPEWLGKAKTDDHLWTGQPEIKPYQLRDYLVERVGKEGFRGYSIAPVSSRCPEGKAELPFQRYGYFAAPITEFRPIVIVPKGTTTEKVWLQTHALHLWARLNCSNFRWVVSRLYENLKQPVREESDESDSTDSSDTDSSDEEFHCSFPSMDEQAVRFLVCISPLHHAILGLAEDSLREFIMWSPSLIERTDFRENTFIYALICLPDPVTEDERAQHLKIWQATKEVLEKAFPEPSALNAFLARKNSCGNTVLKQAVVELNFHAMKMFFTIFKMDPFATIDEKENTILHALAGSKGPAKKQLGMLQDLVKLFFDIEPDVGKRERFYQQKNHSGDTALQVACNAKNKELVQKLLFLPGADTEEKSAAHPKGVDFTGLGIHYGKLLALESALLFERNLAFGERLDSQEEVIACHREAIGAVIGELGEARQSIAMLTDALERSERNQLMLMQVVSALAAGNPDVQRLLAGADGGRVAAPFLALRDLTGAGAGAGEGVEEAKGLD